MTTAEKKRYSERRKKGLRGIEDRTAHDFVCILPGDWTKEGRLFKALNRKERRDLDYKRGKYLEKPAERKARISQKAAMKAAVL